MKHSTFTSRFAARVFLSVILAVICITATAAPIRVSAQEPAAAVRTTTGDQNAVSQPGSVPANPELSEKEEHNIYRHTPIVHSLARMLHLDVETTARLFEFINFAIIALAIVIPLVRIMPRIFRKRSQTLRHDLESARKLTADANARLSAVEAKLAKLDEEVAAIRTHVEEDSKNDEARIKSTIEEERDRIVAAAEQEIATAAAQAKRGLRHFAADLAIEQAARQLELAPETDRALIAEFVSNAVKGEQN